MNATMKLDYVPSISSYYIRIRVVGRLSGDEQKFFIRKGIVRDQDGASRLGDYVMYGGRTEREARAAMATLQVWGIAEEQFVSAPAPIVADHPNVSFLAWLETAIAPTPAAARTGADVLRRCRTLYTRAANRGISREEIHTLILRLFGKTSTKDLTPAEWERVYNKEIPSIAHA